MASSDTFDVPTNATLERFYQVTSGGVAQDITGWAILSEWRYTDDGTLALELTLGNGLLVLVNAAAGQFKVLIPPAELKTIRAGTVSFDILVSPPSSPGASPRVYRPFTGVATVFVGATQAAVS